MLAIYPLGVPWSPISEARESPYLAMQVRLQCPHCLGLVNVKLPYGWTDEVRMNLIRDGIDEHRRICTAADATEGRVYTIEYPRK